MTALPLFITHRNKYLSGALMYAFGYMIYYLTNHYLLFNAKMLPLTWVDEKTPFLHYSVLIYMSEYFYFALVYILLAGSENINRYLYAIFSLQALSCLIFLFFPTIYPRENFPIPNDLPQWLINTWAWLRSQDAPTNCLPSLHVSSAYLSALAFRTDPRKKLFWPFFIWATLIALSTLTTKQHYLADVVSGFILGILFHWWFHHRQRYQSAN